MTFGCQTIVSIMALTIAVPAQTNSMALPTIIPSPLSLLLELGQALHSTLEIDPLLDTILRQMQSAAQGEDVSIWLLDAARTQLTCTHSVGPEAEGLLGQSLSAASVIDGSSWFESTTGVAAAETTDAAGHVFLGRA